MTKRERLAKIRSESIEVTFSATRDDLSRYKKIIRFVDTKDFDDRANPLLKALPRIVGNTGTVLMGGKWGPMVGKITVDRDYFKSNK